MKNQLRYTALISFVLLFNSCCSSVKEEYLGSNLYLSEYNNVDRRILYAKESCSKTGIEIIPMTILEISYNSNWIIAKSGSSNQNSNIGYWIIKNDYKSEPDVKSIKVNTFGPMNFKTFKEALKNRNIDLVLKKIN